MVIRGSQNNSLMCSPVPGTSVSYLSLAASNYWQHIFCSFRAGEVASLASFTTFEPIVNETDIRSSASLPAGPLTLIIGNSIRLNQGTSNSYYREVRLWQTCRSLADISRFRLEQASDASLLVYLKLAGELNEIYNSASLFNTSFPTSANRTSRVVSKTDSLSSLLICP